MRANHLIRMIGFFEALWQVCANVWLAKGNLEENSSTILFNAQVDSDR